MLSKRIVLQLPRRQLRIAAELAWRCPPVLRVLLDPFGNGVQLAVNSPQDKRAAIVEEVKIMLNSYLDNYRYE